jgi:predicted regulator of amino acid metabolism with ACT domain
LAAVLWDVFKDFGWPRVLQSDGDATNVTAVIRTMVAEHGAEHRTITAYNPEQSARLKVVLARPLCASASF